MTQPVLIELFVEGFNTLHPDSLLNLLQANRTAHRPRLPITSVIMLRDLFQSDTTIKISTPPGREEAANKSIVTF
jgi:hypothetical protein